MNIRVLIFVGIALADVLATISNRQAFCWHTFFQVYVCVAYLPNEPNEIVSNGRRVSKSCSTLNVHLRYAVYITSSGCV